MITKWLPGVGGDLPLDPVRHGEAVLGAGDLVQAVEQDQAPAAAQLALPPAVGLAARRAADRGPHHIRQRDRRIGDDRPGVLAQREQDGDAPAAQAPAQAAAALRRAAWASRVLLPLPGWPTSARTTRERRSRSSLIECRCRGVLGLAEQAPGAWCGARLTSATST